LRPFLESGCCQSQSHFLEALILLRGAPCENERQAELLSMIFRAIGLAVISSILVAEAYLLVDKYFISIGPLQVVDWSARALTLEEQNRLHDELRIELIGLTPQELD
jgi:hypothetical protein